MKLDKWFNQLQDVESLHWNIAMCKNENRKINYIQNYIMDKNAIS